MKYPYFIFATFLAPAVGISAFAAEKVDTTSVLGEVVVMEKAAKAPVPLLPLDVRIVNSAVIDKSTESNLLPVLQNRVPGMFVTERGMAGYAVSGDAAGSVNIRGVGGGNKVLFLIDGQPQWAGVFGHSLPDTYVTNDVERVEVVSGPSSLLYGSGAMGGSVNLITRRGNTDGFDGTVRAQAGSYGTQKYGARVGYGHGKWRSLAAASYERTDGNRRGMGYWLANQFASLGYSFSSHWETGANVMLTETKADNPGSIYQAKPLDMWTRMFRTTTSFYVKNHYAVSSGGIQAYHNWGKHKIDDGLKNGKPRDYLFNSKDYNIGVTAYQTIRPWTGNNLSVGLDFKHWGGEAWNSAKADGKESPISDAHVNELGAYAMMQQSFPGDRVSLNAGVRLEHSSQYGNKWIPQAGVVYRPLRNTRAKFSYGRGFRSPNIRELYMYAQRNPELQPESLDNYEIELRRWMAGGLLNIGVAAFYINGDNMIQTVMTDGSPRFKNTGKIINKGVEVDATYGINDDWTLTANYAYLHTDTRILAAPRNKVFAEIDYHPGAWNFTVDALGVSHLMTEKSREHYVLLNARVAYRFDFRTPVILFVKGENLTATRYQINYGFPMPRATVMIGAEWKF